MGKSVEREENMELRLDLSMGGSFTRTPDDKNSGLLPPGSGVFPDHCGAGFRGMYCRNKEETEEVLEQRRRKEMHALRRQAARQKRDEKRGALQLAKRLPGAGDNNDASVQTVVPLMQYVVQNGDKVEYIPVTPGSAFPYVVPYWPASSPPPILSRNSDTAAATASWSGNTTNKRLRDSDSGESSSSAVSDKNRGGSSSASSHPPPEQFEKAEGMTVNNGNDGEKSRRRAMPVAGEKPLKLPQMPCVSTTGDGPNGKTITGFLYRYTKGEVSIMCVCHGESFSPAEFVKHAGGTDVEHPMRHIIIVPSPAG